MLGSYRNCAETKPMTPKQVLHYYTTQSAAAAAIGIKQSAVANMVRRGVISQLSQLKWEAASGGALKANPSILGSRRQSQK